VYGNTPPLAACQQFSTPPFRRLVSTLRPSGFAYQPGGCAAFQHFSNGLHSRKAEVLTSEGAKGGVLNCCGAKRSYQ
jgi:hypothetical protein